jgi:hypothetical protein
LIGYGVLFTQFLLAASRFSRFGEGAVTVKADADVNLVNNGDIVNNVLNIKNNLTGLNLDFMSYASYVRSQGDAGSLIDQDALLRHTQATFLLFFQHYVSSNVSLETGGSAYQPIGANLDDLRGPAESTLRQINPGGKVAVNFQDLPPQNTERLVNATITTRVETPDMSHNAFLVCLVIPCWLVITVIIVAWLHRWTFKELNRNVESIADTLVLI